MRRSCRCRSICRAAGLNRQSLSSPGAGPEDVRQVGDRIRRAVAETSVEDGYLRVGVTVSLGGATFRESSDSTDSLVALADGALYQAKEGGRNRLVVA
jgi:diguanylate cyclase (GGDEF)-like protein